MKIYKLWEDGEKENHSFVAARSYNSALKIFENEKDIEHSKIKGEILLRKNPTSSKDYLKIKISKGIVPEEIDFEYFGGNRGRLSMIRPEVKNFIRKEIEIAVEKYFEREVPELNDKSRNA